MSADRPQYAREIRYALTDARQLCEQLRLIDGPRSFLRQAGGGVLIRCPWHAEKTPSCSVRRAADGTIAVKCHGCGVTGDALSLVAVARGLGLRSAFREVLIEAAELAGLYAIVDELRTGKREESRPHVPPPRPEPEPERDYPPAAEVEALLSTCRPTAKVDAVASWLLSRKLDPDLVDADGLAVAMHAGTRLPRWASYQRRSWLETGHWLLVPMRDAAGAVRTVRAGRVVDGDSPKRLPPGGHKASGVVMADPIGIAMLAGTFKPSGVVVVEGEPDFLARATRRRKAVWATLGIVSGSWSEEFASRLPDGVEVWIRTDTDRAGDAYAAEIVKTIRRRCFPRRLEDDDGQAA